MSEPLDYRMTGCQSPCGEYAEDILSLDKKFVTNPPATFYIRVKGDSKILGLVKGDILLVNKAIAPRNGNLIVAVLSNNFVLGSYQIRNGVGYVMPMNRRLGEDEFNEDFVWGVAQSQHRSLTSESTKRYN
jgi:DNA polymerase V